MAARKIDLVGLVFGKLTVVKEGSGYTEPNRKYKRSTWICECECGNTKEIVGKCLKAGSSKSCGCNSTTNTHGMKGTKEYTAWINMKQRCLNPNHQAYSYYGGRGITVCEEWINSFEAFYEYLGDAPSPEHSIDRIDENKNYYPENVEWGTKQTQSFRRRTPSNNTSGYKGVFFRKDRNKWVAQIKIDGVRKSLGSFDTREKAITAKKAGEERYINTLLNTEV